MDFFSLGLASISSKEIQRIQRKLLQYWATFKTDFSLNEKKSFLVRETFADVVLLTNTWVVEEIIMVICLNLVWP